MMSGTVKESTFQASGNTSLRNSTDGHIRQSIDYANQEQDKEKPYNTISSWRPCVAEYKAMCFSIYGTERVTELMTMEKVYNFLFLQAHRPTRAAGRKKMTYTQKATPEKLVSFCFVERSSVLFCGTLHLWRTIRYSQMSLTPQSIPIQVFETHMLMQ
jgi:hypothetical protein